MECRAAQRVYIPVFFMSFQQKWLALAIVSSAVFLIIVVDMTVLYTALPTLTHDLHASASEKLWIINAYALVVSGLLLGTGTLGDRVGHKRLFVAGLGVFGLASLGAAFSPTPALLIAARAMLGVGAAMMMPSTLSIIRLVFTDERERSLAIGVWASVASGGAALGPVLGGGLLAHFWWGSVFLINVPIVLIAMAATVRLIPAHAGDASRRWDWAGSLQAMVGLIALAYAIKELGKRAPSVLAALLACTIGVLFMVWFLRRQRRMAQPLIDFAIFRHPGFSVAVLAALISSVTLIGMELVYVQRLQLVLDMSPLQAAVFLLPLAIASFVAGPLMGRLLPSLGSKTALVGGLLTAGLGMAACLWQYDAGTAVQAVCLAVLGAGLGATMTAASSTIMHSAPAERAGMAASIEEVSYELGGAIGVTLMGSILSASYTASMLLPEGLSMQAVIALDSLDEALLVAESLPGDAAAALIAAARRAFDQGFTMVLGVGTALLFAAAARVQMRGGRRASQSAAG